MGWFIFTSMEEIVGINQDWTNSSWLYTCQWCNAWWTQTWRRAFQGKLEGFTRRICTNNWGWKKYLLWHQMLLSKLKKQLRHQWFYIPVFPGTNSEYDSAKGLWKEGAKVNLVPFVTLNEEAIVKSVDTMVKQHRKSEYYLLCGGGFSAADEPDGSAKFIVNILLNEKVRAAIDRFIEGGGLIIGICNGFQALVKSGLLPYGNFEDASSTSPTLFYNDA